MSKPWDEVLLGDLAELRIGKTPTRSAARYWTTDLARPFCTIADMGDGSVGPCQEGVTELAESEGRAKRMPAGAMLMSFKLTIGRVGFASYDVFPNEAIVWVKPVETERVSERYLAAYLETYDYSALTGRAAKGVTLNSKSLRAVPVRLPLLAVQERLAETVQVFDTTLIAAKRHEAATSALADSLLETELASPGFVVCPLGEVLDNIDGGRSPRCPDRSPARGEWGVLRTTAVQPNRFVPTEAKALEDESLLFPQAQVRRGDLLILRASGSQKRVGHACVVELEPERLLLSDLIYRLHPDPETDPEYLSLALSSAGLRRQIEGRAVGSSSMRKLNHGLLRALDVPMAPLGRQKEAVERLRPALAAARAASETVRRLRTARRTAIGTMLAGELSLDAAAPRAEAA